MKRTCYGKLNESYWIGGENGIYPMTANKYTFTCSYMLREGDTAKIVVAARNKDNYLMIKINHTEGKMHVYDVCDNAWTDGIKRITLCGPEEGYPVYSIRRLNEISITVAGRSILVRLNNRNVIDREEILPETGYFVPLKNRLMLAGADAGDGSLFINNPVVIIDGKVFKSYGVEQLEICNGFELFSNVPCVNVRRRIRLDKEIKSAVMYASARGFYNAYVNGMKAGNEYFAPGFVDYRLRIQYQKYDITELLKAGDNIVSAVVSQGYYSGFAGYNTDACVYGEQNSFIGRIEIEYADGSCENIVTDEEWELAECEPVIFADMLQGEYYDARLELAGIPWDKCSIVPDPAIPVPTNGEIDGLEFTMEEQDYQGVREVMTLSGRCCGECPAEHLVFDMGQNMVGTVRIRMKGRFGESIKIRYGEMCRKDGSVYLSNLRSAANTDIYISNGKRSGELFVPDLTAHGFRYVEITGNGKPLSETGIEIEGVEGIVLSNTDKITGNFECSEELINKLFSNIMWGQRGNYMLIPTDCPQRNERMGWTGDAQVFARTAAYNMDVYEFTRKWLRDLREAQLMYNMDGAVPDIAPLCGDNRGGCGGWADAAVIVPWEMYRAYGKKEILEENYDMMKAWVDYANKPERLNNGIRTVNGSEIPEKSDLSDKPFIQPQQRRGDHLAVDESTPFILSATAYAAYCAELLSEIAAVLGKAEDAEKYRELYENIKEAFRTAWMQPDGTLAYWGEMSKDGINETRYSEDGDNHPSQTAYALAINFGLIDVKEYPRAAECFKRTIDERGGKLSTGFLGIEHLLPALTKCGLADTAFKLMEQKQNPGWLYSVINGATTIWERWNSYIAATDTFGSVSMNSFNHYAYGAVGEWLYGSVLGINPLEPGYRSIMLTPHFGGSLTYAKGSVITEQGEIKTGWRIDGDRFIYNYSVPEGVRTVITMPDGAVYESEESCGELSIKL